MHVRVCLFGAFVPLQLVACVPDVIYALGGTFNWHFHKGLQFVITDVRRPLSSLSMWWTRCVRVGSGRKEWVGIGCAVFFWP